MSMRNVGQNRTLQVKQSMRAQDHGGFQDLELKFNRRHLSEERKKYI